MVELDMTGKIVSHQVTNSGEPLRQIGYGSFTNPATQVVLNAYQKFGQGDVPGILAICNDDVVFILVEAEYTQRSTGKMYTTTYTHHFRIVNGKISYFRGLDDFQMTKQ
ncbi:MAG: nuclear transport factor 2 family protein [Saprospiraceae bacterium]